MTDFEPLRPDVGEFAPVNPVPPPPRVAGFTPDLSVTDDKVAYGISPRKMKLIGAKVYRSTNQTFNDGVEDEMSFDTEVYDEGGFWTIDAPTRLTVPYDGVYAVALYADFNANAVGYRKGNVHINGAPTVVLTRTPTAGQSTSLWLTGLHLKLTAGDYIELALAQTSGGNLDTQTGQDGNFGSIHFLGTL